MKPRVGDLVEVRSKDEILSTLDKNGRLDGLPFMPQMFSYCGQQFRVYKSAHKTCDTVSGEYTGRKVPDGIHLEHRCDGQAYDGCQAGCLIFWKKAWLKPLASNDGNSRPAAIVEGGISCTMDDVMKGTRRLVDRETLYVCQATQLLEYTAPLKWWDARQYVEDYASGNATLGRIFQTFAYFAYYYGTLANRFNFGIPARWLYDKVRLAWNGLPFPRQRGKFLSGKEAPLAMLKLQPGDLVRVKSYEEILATIDQNNMNRGLVFDAELVPYCGKIYRVAVRIHTFIDERTGKMRSLKTPAVILDGVHCRSYFSPSRLFCPRSIFSWWREVWLEKLSEGAAATSDAQPLPKNNS